MGRGFKHNFQVLDLTRSLTTVTVQDPRQLMLVLVATLVFCGSSFSQLGAPNPEGPFADALERRRAEMDLRMVPLKLRERMIRNFSDPRLVKQMNEDFLQIQAIRAEMAKVFTDGAEMTVDKLKGHSRDVRRRATRLRSLLSLSEDFKDVNLPQEYPLTIESLNARAHQLCLEISRFTGNPMFKAKGVITVNNAKEASETLDLVISLAEMLEKESKRLADQ